MPGGNKPVEALLQSFENRIRYEFRATIEKIIDNVEGQLIIRTPESLQRHNIHNPDTYFQPPNILQYYRDDVIKLFIKQVTMAQDNLNNQYSEYKNAELNANYNKWYIWCISQINIMKAKAKHQLVNINQLIERELDPIFHYKQVVYALSTDIDLIVEFKEIVYQLTNDDPHKYITYYKDYMSVGVYFNSLVEQRLDIVAIAERLISFAEFEMNHSTTSGGMNWVRTCLFAPLPVSPLVPAPYDTDSDESDFVTPPVSPR